jgi:YVTN family beta-propeller protein
VRRRALALVIAIFAALVAGACSSGAPDPGPSQAAAAPATAPAATAARRPAKPVDRTPSSARRLRLVRTITGDLSSKSVVSSQHGHFFAQNMMYRHTISVYDRRGRLVKTIPDAVDLSRFGVRGHPGTVRGAPVEAAFLPDGTAAYVSNYSMYGAGFGPEGNDVCSPSSGYDDSFVYRVDARSLRIVDAIRVGAVPKYVAVTPDGKRVLVSNWCSWDLSVINVAKGAQSRRIPLGRYPRGIAVGPSGKYAYVAVMGSTDIARVKLADLSVSWLRGVGNAPRHLVIDGAGDFLYATLNGEGRVAKINLRTGRVVAKVATGTAPRSMAIAPDGRSLYVVNYESNTVSKVRTRDMAVIQTVATNADPIGIDYDRDTRQVWVACYTGSLMVFRDV